jgi:hypothetical protein
MSEVWPGDAYPLGARFDGAGTNFAVFSELAERVELGPTLSFRGLGNIKSGETLRVQARSVQVLRRA